MAKSKPKSATIAVFKVGGTKVTGGPTPTEKITPDGGALSLLFDQPLLSFHPEKAAVTYREIKVVIRLAAPPTALIVQPRFAVTRLTAAVLLTTDIGGIRDTVDIGPENTVREWEPRCLLSSALLERKKTLTLVIAFQSETTDNTGEVEVMLDSIDIQAVSP